MMGGNHEREESSSSVCFNAEFIAVAGGCGLSIRDIYGEADDEHGEETVHAVGVEEDNVRSDRARREQNGDQTGI
jgi:hypothetical protein